MLTAVDAATLMIVDETGGWGSIHTVWMAPAVTDVVLGRRLLAEYVGSGLLAAVVIGSGIAAQRLSPGQTGLQLFENAAATAAGLFAIILMVGPVSGGHFNPVVSFVDAAFGGLSWRQAVWYLPAQVAGCISGAVLANAMFALAAVSISTKDRASGPHFLSEVVATVGLLLVIFALVRTDRARMAPAAVGAYIGAAYWFTSSTSFANPAITVGRMFSNTFAGIAPSSVPSFVGAQILGGVVAFGLIRVLYPDMTASQAAAVVLPHASTAEVAAHNGLADQAPFDGAADERRAPTGPPTPFPPTES
jgi:arsenate reductase